MHKIIKAHLASAIQITEAYDENKKLMAENENIIIDLYHILEFVKLDAVQLIKVTKKLREKLRLRREIKEDYASIQSILDTPVNKLIRRADELQLRRNERASKNMIESQESFKRIFPD